MTAPVLVTGACGLVGRATVRRLLEDGRTVVATDVRTEATEQVAAGLEELEPGRCSVRWVDLTDAGQVRALLVSMLPSAVIHLAAVIPPLCYSRPAVARAVNVGATGHLLDACAGLEAPPRFIQASSVAVHGSRNPHTCDDLLGADTAVAPSDLYGAHKAEAETLVRASALDWVVLRLGGVLTVERVARWDGDLAYLGAALPSDGRIQTIDVRDVATAMAVATTADVVGRTLMIGGDETHRVRQHEVAEAMTAASGLDGAIPEGLPGDPADDAAWFATDWMDTAPAQAALDFQHHSLPAMVAEARAGVGWSRFAMRLLAPVVHTVLDRRSPYRGLGRDHADPWLAVERRWGSYGPDRSVAGPG